MPRKVQNIHDKFIKELLSNREVAESFLREYLPQQVVALLDFGTMIYLNTSYLSKQLQASYSDMVWQISTLESETIRVSVLLEHKSYPDANVAFQMLEYIALGYQTQLKNKQKLELILPILYYHGQEKWHFRSISQHFENLSDEFKTYIPTYTTEFIDLNALNQQQILGLRHGLLRAALLLQQNYYSAEGLNNSIKNILESLNPYLDLNPTEFIFVYMIQNGKLNKVQLEESLKILPPPFSDKIMSIYDELIQEGRIEGIQEGIKRGIEQGIQQGIVKGAEQNRINTILNAFDNGVDLNLIRVISGESMENIKDILRENNRI
ncbi:MAG: Rpn family recombination-promoting nuclease/putative transposase [Emticicia sp.]|nr:Rpn family recombination-promoting nuclease/putative transposase [Emticicia sp.]